MSDPKILYYDDWEIGEYYYQKIDIGDRTYIIVDLGMLLGKQLIGRQYDPDIELTFRKGNQVYVHIVELGNYYCKSGTEI